ncbi:hypothetical protein ACXR6G_17525 [Ancylomarina sp. YFZ004]
MSYSSNFFVSLDQLGNTIAGGNPDNTISARIGYYNYHDDYSKEPALHWKLFMYIVDTTFYPIDGERHCHEAYHNDSGEYFDETKNWAIAILAIFIIPCCLLIGLILYTLLVMGLVSPKNIDLNNNIKQRIIGANNRLKGTLHEFNEYDIQVNSDIKELYSETQTLLTIITNIIHSE